MKEQYEFYYSKDETLKKLIKNILYFILSLLFYFLMVLNQKSELFTQIALAAVPVYFLYISLKVWKEYKFSVAALIINKQSLHFRKLNLLLKMKIKEIQIDEIKKIAKETKIRGNSVQTKLLSLEMLNSDILTFDIKAFGLSPDELYRIIKEMNPEAKLLNVG
jgi:hypothetical protein